MVLFAAVVMVASAFLFGLRELYGVGIGAFAIVVVSRLWVDARRCDLQIHRAVHPNRVPAGQEARVELAVRNQGSRSSPAVEARDPFDGGRRWARFSIAPLRPNEVRRGSYRLPSTRRGVYHLGPLELSLADPLGLARRTRTTAADTTLTVHPYWEPVTILATSSHRDDDRRSPHPSIGKGGNEFYALREYVPGDDLRHVHWPSTARQGDLVIRQPENLRRGRLTIASDLRAGIHDDTTLESSLSAAASLAMSALGEGLQVRVVTTAGWDSGHGQGRLHGPAILDGLAAAALHPPRTGISPFRVAGRSDPVIVVTTDRATGEDLESAIRLGGPLGTTIVAFETAGSASRAGLPPNSRTIKVPIGTPFPKVWKRWEMAWS